MGGFRLGMPSFTRPKPLKTKPMRFSTWLASAILMWSAGTAWAQCDNLFFSEAAEGSSNNKYLEIYNPLQSDRNALTEMHIFYHCTIHIFHL